MTEQSFLVQDLYMQLEKQGRLHVVCLTLNDFNYLKTSIHRVRRRQLAAFAAIDDVEDADGKQLVMKYFGERQLAEIELKRREEKFWLVVEVPVPATNKQES